MAQDQNILNEIISPATTLLATFFGACLAFLLQNIREKKKEENNNVAALNKVQINFVQQLNALIQLNEDLIVPYKESTLNWIAIPAPPLRDYSHLKIDAGTLTFLSETNNTSLISDILIEEEKFKEVIKILNLRSKAHTERLQPKLEAKGFKEGDIFDYTAKQTEEMLGPHLIGDLKKLTAGFIDQTTATIQSHKKTINKIATIGSKIFPKKTIFGFEYTNKENNEQDQA